LEFLFLLQPGIGIKEAYRVVRERVPPIKGDRRFSEDIKKIRLLAEAGELLPHVGKIVEGLK
jgi:histidine ammonia-lyase